MLPATLIQILPANHDVSLIKCRWVATFLFKLLVVVSEHTRFPFRRGCVLFPILFKNLHEPHSDFFADKIITVGLEVDPIVPVLFPIVLGHIKVWHDGAEVEDVTNTFD